MTIGLKVITGEVGILNIVKIKYENILYLKKVTQSNIRLKN